jgi:MFS family permease
MIFWGRMADRYGRKPVLVFSLIGLTITVTLFGVSRTVWQMILIRSMGGLFSGSAV